MCRLSQTIEKGTKDCLYLLHLNKVALNVRPEGRVSNSAKGVVCAIQFRPVLKGVPAGQQSGVSVGHLLLYQAPSQCVFFFFVPDVQATIKSKKKQEHIYNIAATQQFKGVSLTSKDKISI